MAAYRGVVQKGKVRVEGGLPLPDGTGVVIRPLDEDEEGEVVQGITGAEILASGLVGMWADRDDIGDSAEFVEKLRRRWERRED